MKIEECAHADLAGLIGGMVGKILELEKFLPPEEQARIASVGWIEIEGQRFSLTLRRSSE